MASRQKVLQGYRDSAWNLRHLAAQADHMVAEWKLTPVSDAVTPGVSQRTIRFYILCGLVPRPEGRGVVATYGYGHLLAILAIKALQARGVALAQIAATLKEKSEEELEQLLANGSRP